MNYNIDKIFVGSIVNEGEEKYIPLIKDRSDILFMDLKSRIYYCSPNSCLKLGRGRLKTVESIKKYIKTDSETISSEMIEEVIFNLNKQLNTNIKDVVLSNIMYMKNYILSINLKDVDRKNLLNELRQIFIDYCESIDERSNELESNSSNQIGTKIEYIKRIMFLYDKTKKLINYSEDFDNQRKELNSEFNKLLK